MLHDDVTRNRNMHCWGRKRRLYSSAAIVLLLLLVAFFLTWGRCLLRSVLEHVYTPPALTRDKLALYERFIQVAQAHPEHGRVFLNTFGTLRVDTAPYSVKNADDARELLRNSGFSADEAAELGTISKGLRRVGCVWVEKENWHVVFMPWPTYILPRSPGVLYSLDGRNPNTINDDFVNRRKPFMPIKDHWYSSRRLVISPFRRIDTEVLLPKSFIDLSLQDPGPLPADE